MFCENCGSKLPDDSLYCPNCGYKVEYNCDPKQKAVTAKKPQAAPVSKPQAAPASKPATPVSKPQAAPAAAPVSKPQAAPASKPAAPVSKPQAAPTAAPVSKPVATPVSKSQVPVTPAYEQPKAPVTPVYEQPKAPVTPAYEQPKPPVTPTYEQPIYQQADQTYDQAAYQQDYQYNGAYEQTEPAFSMKWYKFVVYVQLFLAALSALGSGIMMMTGLHYGGYSEHVYAAYGDMKIIDIAFGIFYLVCIPIAIITRQKLAKYKADGPMFLMLTIVLSLAISLLYAVSSALVTGVNVFDATVIGTIIGNVALIVGNHIYFKKRKDLFCN
ncbi:MAG: zinc-ribbon domain-containing protein [Ruminococcus sp.]|nr:zinc-ribbon domain-containing protein [Ruminococcus sp.]